MFFLATFFLLIASVHATPAIEFPLNAQIPPIARVSNPFQFVFSESTFSSVESGTIIYSISNSPSWLHLDSRNRTLYGTPKLDDVGKVKFKLIGTDANGSTNMPVTLIVSKDSGTVLNESASPLLAEDGELSDIASFSVHPSKPFSFSVDPDTFISPGENNSLFYATTADKAPLPSWVTFDSTNLSFSGTSPSASQIFNFNVVAADIEGFRSATTSLKIAVSPHILSFEQVLLDFNVTIGEHFNTSKLRDTLLIDGKPLEDDDLASVNADFPDWLTLDEDTLLLSGTPPKSVKSDTAIISVSDIYGNIANITIRFRLQSQSRRPLFSEKAGNYYIVAGEDFSYTFDDSFLEGKSVEIDADHEDNFPWIECGSGGRTLHGRAPEDMEAQTITIPLLASNDPKNETIPFTIRVYNDNKTCTSIASSSATPCHSSSSFSSSTSAPESATVATDKKEYIIPIAVIIPIFILGVGLILIYSRRNKSWFAICTRKKSKKTDPDITAPEIEKTATQPGTELSKEIDTDSPFGVPPPRPLSGSVSPLSNRRNSFTRRQGANPDDENRSSISMFSQIFSRPASRYGVTMTSEKNASNNFAGKPHGAALKTATSARKRGSFNPHWPRERSLSAETIDFPPTPNPRAICPHGRKMSNSGHGPSGSISPVYDAANRSWQTTQTSLPTEPSLGSLTSRFPLPPALRSSRSPDSKRPERPERPDRESTDTVLLPSPRRFSESENWKTSKNQEPGKGYTVSPLFSGRPTPSGSLSKDNAESRRSNNWRTTNNSLSTYPGSHNNLQDYPQQPLRSPSFGSVFNVGFGFRRPSADPSIQHSRTRSQRSHESGSGSGSQHGSQHGWTTTGRLGSSGNLTEDIEEEPGSYENRRWYGVPPPPPPHPSHPPPPIPPQQQQQLPKTRKYSYPIFMSKTANPSARHDYSKSSNSNDPTASSSAKNLRTRQASDSSSASHGTDGGRGQNRWKLGETQESRYASIRNDSVGTTGPRSGNSP